MFERRIDQKCFHSNTYKTIQKCINHLHLTVYKALVNRGVLVEFRIESMGSKSKTTKYDDVWCTFF